MSASSGPTNPDGLLIRTKGGRGNRQHVVHDLYHAGHSTEQVREFLKDAGYSKSRISQLMKESRRGISQLMREEKEKDGDVGDPIEHIDGGEDNTKAEKGSTRKRQKAKNFVGSSDKCEKAVRKDLKRNKCASSAVDPGKQQKDKVSTETQQEESASLISKSTSGEEDELSSTDHMGSDSEEECDSNFEQVNVDTSRPSDTTERLTRTNSSTPSSINNPGCLQPRDNGEIL